MNHRLNFGLPVLIIGLALCGMGLWLLFSPPHYKAVVTIKIEPAEVSATSDGEVVPYDPYFIETELKKIESEIVLSNVVQALSLDVEWGKRYGHGQQLGNSETIELLRHHMVLDAERNTKLVDIGVIDQDPDEAARIANSIAEAYADYRVDEHKRQMATGIKVLEDKYQEKETEIKNEEAQLELLMKQSGSTNPPPTNEVLMARRHLADKETLHELLKAKIDADNADVSIPITTLVAIVEPAVAPKDPIAPNRWLGAIILVCGLVASYWGFHSLFVGGRVTGIEP